MKKSVFSNALNQHKISLPFLPILESQSVNPRNKVNTQILRTFGLLRLQLTEVIEVTSKER